MTAAVLLGAGLDTSGRLTGLTGWAAELMTNLGGPGVGAIVALENLFRRSRAKSYCRSPDSSPDGAR